MAVARLAARPRMAASLLEQWAIQACRQIWRGSAQLAVKTKVRIIWLS